MTDLELKPCPFCGCHAASLTQRDARYGLIVYVECQICGARTKPVGTKEDSGDDWDTPACYSAAKLWNTRDGS